MNKTREAHKHTQTVRLKSEICEKIILILQHVECIKICKIHSNKKVLFTFAVEVDWCLKNDDKRLFDIAYILFIAYGMFIKGKT